MTVRSKLSIVFLLFLLVGCGPSAPIGPIQLEVHLRLDGKPYSFNPKVGDGYTPNTIGLTEFPHSYFTSGNFHTAGNGKLVRFGQNISLWDRDENVYLKIGFLTDPSNIDRLDYDCEARLDHSEALLIPGDYDLCASRSEVCYPTEKDKLYFEITLSFPDQDEVYYSTFHEYDLPDTATGTFFRIEKVERFHFEQPDGGNITNFEYLIEGVFNAVLTEATSEKKLYMQDSDFKIGIWDLVLCNEK